MRSGLENKTWRTRTVLERTQSFPIDLPALRIQCIWGHRSWPEPWNRISPTTLPLLILNTQLSFLWPCGLFYYARWLLLLILLVVLQERQFVRLHQLSAVHFSCIRMPFWSLSASQMVILVILCCCSLMSNNFRSCFLGGHRLYCALLERRCKNNRGGSQTLVNKIKFCRKASFAWLDFL